MIYYIDDEGINQEGKKDKKGSQDELGKYCKRMNSI